MAYRLHSLVPEHEYPEFSKLYDVVQLKIYISPRICDWNMPISKAPVASAFELKAAIYI